MINIGDIFETTSGFCFLSLETKDISEGESFKAQCQTAGSIGNVPKGVINIIPNTIQGLNIMGYFITGNTINIQTDMMMAQYTYSLKNKNMTVIQSPNGLLGLVEAILNGI